MRPQLSPSRLADGAIERYDTEGDGRLSGEELKRDRGVSMKGVYVGTDRVNVSHPQVSLPSAYQTGDAIGEEVARDTVAPSR